MKLPRVMSGRRRRILARLVAIALGQSVAAITLAWLVRGIIDAQIRTSVPRPWIWFAAAAPLLVIAIGFLRRCERVDAERLAQSYIHRLRRALFERLCRSDVLELQRVHRGALMLRFISDLGSIGEWVSVGIARLLVTAITVGVTLLMLAVYDLRAAALVGILLAGGLGIAAILGRSLNAAVIHVRRRRAHLAANLTEKAHGFIVVNAFAQGRREGRRLRRQSAHLKSAIIESARRAGTLDAVADGTAALMIIAALGYGVLAHAAGTVSAGVVVACVTIVAQLAGPVRDIAHVYERWCRYRLSREKLRTFLAGGRRPSRARALPDAAPAATIDLEGVTVDGRLHAVTAHIAAGSRVAVWGPAGGGKSTLLAVLAGRLKPDAGGITLLGNDLSLMSGSELQHSVGLYGADLPLVRGSVRRNLRYRLPDAQPAEIAAAARQFGVDELLSRWPAGVRTRVTDQGGNLSQGERQRLALTRAWLGTPRLLLLDDLDSIADPLLRAQLRSAIASYRGTIVMVTQQSDLLALADCAWRIAAGELTHTQPATRADEPDVLMAQAVTGKAGKS